MLGWISFRYLAIIRRPGGDGTLVVAVMQLIVDPVVVDMVSDAMAGSLGSL
jgi:hypothetical protein